MTIFNSNGTTLVEIVPDDSSYHVETLMGDNHVMLYFSSDTHIDIPVGAYILHNGARYTVLYPESIKLQHRTLFEYTIQFHAMQGYLQLWKFRNYVDGRTKFSLTATAQEHLSYIINDLNNRTTNSIIIGGTTFDLGTGITWSGSSGLNTAEKLISYDNITCMEALELIAETFDTEYKISGTSILLEKIEINKDTPHSMAYGRGNGFLSGVTRSNAGSLPPIDVLYVQGGDTNIDKSKYSYDKLQLPYSSTIPKYLAYDGQYFDDEAGFDSDKSYVYFTINGYTILNANMAISGQKVEASIDCSDIYPKRVGKVTAVTKNSQGIYTITDNTIASTLNYANYVLAGETLTIIFQTGQLAGREFEVQYNHTNRQFRLAQIEEQGLTLPAAGGYEPAVNDEYVVFHCSMPNAYIRDDVNRAGASWDMFRQAVREMYEMQLQQYTFQGSVDPVYLYNNRRTLTFSTGMYISFTDTDFQQAAMLMRVTTIKTDINSGLKKELTMSTATVRRSRIKTTLNKSTNMSDNVLFVARNIEKGTKRTFRTVNDNILNLDTSLRKKIDDTAQDQSALIPFISRNISNNEQTLFRTIKSFDDHADEPDTIDIQYGNVISIGATYIQSYFIGMNNIAPARKEGDYNCYYIPELEAAAYDKDTAYYVYAIIRNETEGIKTDNNYFYITQYPLAIDEYPNSTIILFAYISQNVDGQRQIARLYGNSPVTGSQITTKKILFIDGVSEIDLEQNKFILGDKVAYNDSSLSLTNPKLKGAINNYTIATEQYYETTNEDRVIIMKGNKHVMLYSNPIDGLVLEIHNLNSSSALVETSTPAHKIYYNGSYYSEIDVAPYSSITLQYIESIGWLKIKNN